jgi:C4-dicarboxylate-specific signal transduction histidine kinase
LLALALQSALIATLIVQRRRRQEAEIEAGHRRAELVHASRLALAGELAASIAHEINQPLGAILANTGAADAWLRRIPPDLDEIRLINADIHRESLRAGEIIRRVRALVTKGDVERQATDINTLIVDTLTLLRTEALQREVTLESVLGTDLSPLHVDRVQLQQALLNLCVNAMDAMSDIEASHRRLVVRTEKRDGGMEIAVSDQGPGIQPDQLPRLFDSFFTTKAQGMGLGLSITRSIVEAHGGTLSGENNADGGATFRIFLHDEAVTPAPAHALAASARGGDE